MLQYRDPAAGRAGAQAAVLQASAPCACSDGDTRSKLVLLLCCCCAKFWRFSCGPVQEPAVLRRGSLSVLLSRVAVRAASFSGRAHSLPVCSVTGMHVRLQDGAAATAPDDQYRQHRVRHHRQRQHIRWCASNLRFNDSVHVRFKHSFLRKGSCKNLCKRLLESWARQACHDEGHELQVMSGLGGAQGSWCGTTAAPSQSSAASGNGEPSRCGLVHGCGTE